ncbi:MAG: hypothetical protein DRH04_07920, partial [Deltaproteobacteria bacterium]
HYGEYFFYATGEKHFFSAPIQDLEGFDNYTTGPADRDYASGVRIGLLHAPIPVFTIGLGVTHYEPMISNTTEYDLYMIAETSNNTTIPARYYYSPDSSSLKEIYRNISSFISLAGDIPGESISGIQRIYLEASSLGLPGPLALYDDGMHMDGAAGDEVYSTDCFTVSTAATGRLPAVITARDVSGHEISYPFDIQVDNTPPAVESIRFNITNTTAEIMAVAVDEESGVSRVWAELDLPGFGSVPMHRLYGNLYTTGALDVMLAPWESLSASVHAEDVAGNTNHTTSVYRNLPSPESRTLYTASPLNGSYINTSVVLRVCASDVEHLSSLWFTLDGAEIPAPDGRLELQLPEGQHSFTATAVWEDGVSLTTEAAVFTVDTTPPVITRWTPVDGDVNTTLFISAHINDSSPLEVWALLDCMTAYSMSLTDGMWYASPDVSEGHHTAVITARDAAGNTASVSARFLIDWQDPEITVSDYPREIPEGEPLEIVFHVEDLSTSEVTLVLDGLGTYYPLPQGSGMYTCTIYNLTPGAHLLTVTARDQAGHSASEDYTVTVVPSGEHVEYREKRVVDWTYVYMLIILAVVLSLMLIGEYMRRRELPQPPPPEEKGKTVEDSIYLPAAPSSGTDRYIPESPEPERVEASSQPEHPPTGKTVRCPVCGGDVPVPEGERPIRTVCPKCGAKGVIR